MEEQLFAPGLGWVKRLEAEGAGVLKTTTWLLILPLSGFTVTTEIDSFADIDYSLMEAPRATAQMLDVMFKVRVLEQGHGWVRPQHSIPSGPALT